MNYRPLTHRARGAQTNPQGRFAAYRVEPIEEAWADIAPDPVIRTEAVQERPRSAITSNQSPDLGFERSLNPYRGCEHGCIYCYARPSHAYLDLGPGLDFETKLVMRPGIAEVLEREFGRKSYRPKLLAIGTNTDPYQPVERDARIMRQVLEVLARWQHPVTITTKGALILRDLDILAEMAAENLVNVGISLTSLDAKLSRKMEPRAAAPATRLRMIEALSQAGVPVRAMIAPVVPGLTDHELEALVAAAAERGAQAAEYIVLRLPGEVADLWADWMAAHYPDRANRVSNRLKELHNGDLYNAGFGQRMSGTGPQAKLIRQRFRLACKRAGIGPDLPGLEIGKFAKPLATADQPSLF